MIRPASEIEYPASEAQRHKASMLQRMEALQSASNSLMAIISARIGAEVAEDEFKVGELTAEQEKLIDNMRRLARG